jgi:hypothetical protein
MNQSNHRKILAACLAASLLLHVIGIAFLQRYSLWFSSPSQNHELSDSLNLIDKKQRDEILKVAFKHVSAKKEESAHPTQETIDSVQVHSPVQLPDHENPVLFQNPFPFSSHDFLDSKPISFNFPIPLESFNLLAHLPKDLIIPMASKRTTQTHYPVPTIATVTLSNTPPEIHYEAPQTTMAHSEPIPSPPTPTKSAVKPLTTIPIPNLPKLPTLAELETSSYSDSFDADLVYLHKEDGSGYLFALTLIPRSDLELPRIPQHITFLIDRSNSIQQGRLSATKAAVHKALEDLSPEDTFNIIAFDSKMEKMSPNALPCIGSSYAIAEGFLEKIQLGSFFSSSEIHKSLFVTVPGQAQTDEIHNAILLTDGEALGKKNAQHALLRDWTEYNKGKVVLYALGMNTDAHIPTLETAAVFNKGKFITAPTNRGLKRKLLKLLKTIRNPIAKNLSCKAITRSPDAHIQIYPKSTHVPNLYVDQPYVILGETDSLDDFILFVQGRLKGRWLNIKKTVSFLNARKGNKALRQEWALQQAYNLYEKYAADSNPQHLAEAKDLLDPFDYDVAFR